MNIMERLGAVLAVLLVLGSSAWAVPYTVSYLDGSTWPGETGMDNFGVYAQGFNTQLGATPDPGITVGDPVPLDRFEFYKAGNPDPPDMAADPTDVKLAIVTNIWMNLADLNSGSGSGTAAAEFVGLSTNTYASTAAIPTGGTIPFFFDSLELDYGTDYAAIFVNEDLGTGELTPVLVNVLTADFVETAPESGVFVPESNYGTNVEYQLGTTNFIDDQSVEGIPFLYFAGFTDAADADFLAAIDSPALWGDYNGDNVVDGADYTVYRDLLDTNPNGYMVNDATPYVIDATDFTQWTDNFGNTAPGAGSGASVANVPEPSSLALLGTLAAFLAIGMRPRAMSSMV